MILPPYNFDDSDQADRFINDLKDESPGNDTRNRLLDELRAFISETVDQSQAFEETIDRKAGIVTTTLDRKLGELSVLSRQMDVKIQEIRSRK